MADDFYRPMHARRSEHFFGFDLGDGPDRTVWNCAMCANVFYAPDELWFHLWRWHHEAIAGMRFESVMAIAAMLGQQVYERRIMRRGR